MNRILVYAFIAGAAVFGFNWAVNAHDEWAYLISFVVAAVFGVFAYAWEYDE